MKVSELIAFLQMQPRDAEVRTVYDGRARAGVGLVWLSRSGHVVLCDSGELVHDDRDMPAGMVRGL